LLRQIKRKEGIDMFFHQSDILQGLEKDFLKKFMEITKRETFKSGHALYKEGDRADHFFILLNGRVKISIGETGHVVYTVDRAGEFFGWSSLVGRNKYAASAECMETAMLLRIDVGELNRLLEKDAPAGLILYRNLSASLGNRLLQTYRLIPGMGLTDFSRSYGTGQLQESDVNASLI